jgi:hypothetical protein
MTRSRLWVAVAPIAVLITYGRRRRVRRLRANLRWVAEARRVPTVAESTGADETRRGG